VTPFLGDAANAANLSDLFACPAANTMQRMPDGCFRLNATGLIPGTTNVVEASRDFIHWTAISTNLASSSSFTFVDLASTNYPSRFYRVVQK
jgi:hypothetical protein